MSEPATVLKENAVIPPFPLDFVFLLQITGEDRNQLMRLQYRIGKLELDNMELEQSRIVHESAMRGKDLTIEKLQLQVRAVCNGRRFSTGAHGVLLSRY